MHLLRVLLSAFAIFFIAVCAAPSIPAQTPTVMSPAYLTLAVTDVITDMPVQATVCQDAV